MLQFAGDIHPLVDLSASLPRFLNNDFGRVGQNAHRVRRRNRCSYVHTHLLHRYEHECNTSSFSCPTGPKRVYLSEKIVVVLSASLSKTIRYFPQNLRPDILPTHFIYPIFANKRMRLYLYHYALQYILIVEERPLPCKIRVFHGPCIFIEDSGFIDTYETRLWFHCLPALSLGENPHSK